MLKPAPAAVAAVAMAVSLAMTFPATAGPRHRLKPKAQPHSLAAAAPQTPDHAPVLASGEAGEDRDTASGWDTIYSAGGPPITPRGGPGARNGPPGPQRTARPLRTRAAPSPL